MLLIHRRWQTLAILLAPGLWSVGCVDDEAVFLDGTGESGALSGSSDGSGGDEEGASLGSDGDEAAPPPLATDRAAEPEFVPLEAIVKFRTATPIDPRASFAAVAGAEAVGPELHLVRFAADRSAGVAAADPIAATRAWIDELRAHPDVEFAHPNWLFTPSLIPNDPRYVDQWNYPQINLPQAWDLTTGVSTVRIAILDSGRTGHEDLADRWVPGVEYDALGEDGDASSSLQQIWNHGVAVASIAGGKANNSKHTAGVCWGCQLLNVNVSRNNGKASLEAAIRGIYWAVDNGARVINMSFEDPHNCMDLETQALPLAVKYAIDRNVVVVAAAGNAGKDAYYTSPASCPNVIAVAATDRDEALAAYSNYGSVALAAPGGGAPFVNGTIVSDGLNIDCDNDVYSQFGQSTAGVVVNWTTYQHKKQCTRYLAGTSFAAPHVAGVVGLMLSRNPKLTLAQVRNILQSTAQPACGGNCGAGLLDARAAVEQAASLPPGGDPKPNPSFTVQCSGLQCTFDASNSTDNEGIVAYDWLLPDEQLKSGKIVWAYMPGYHGIKAARLRVTDTRGQSYLIQKIFSFAQPVVNPSAGQYHSVTRPDNRFHLFNTSDDALVLTWYTFDLQGDPVWYSSDPGHRLGARWSQTLYETTWKNQVAESKIVGEVSLDFSSSSDVWFSWLLNGKRGGERYTRQFGGLGRSGVWYVPTELGWGISVQESGQGLEGVVSFPHGGKPAWVRSAMMTPSSNLQNVPLKFYSGKGLCPSCGGTKAAEEHPYWSGWMNLQIANSDSTNGLASVEIRYQVINLMWRRLQQQIAILTKP
ncbi:S8 family peptidase [Nannocystis radixulma]|uniref:S8 family serine peptidase n=1 Tax=Nannocystis radixulma TaxID=2995305 RepID=A0ABT5B8H9_9BACT|nr:S8 family serine peptidase [Nannocystis radixulma]MDC0670421.1 S8 family serine peptidase [Nannocystis radixulma]